MISPSLAFLLQLPIRANRNLVIFCDAISVIVATRGMESARGPSRSPDIFESVTPLSKLLVRQKAFSPPRFPFLIALFLLLFSRVSLFAQLCVPLLPLQ